VSHISRITIGRVYNLGNYEHVRYELSIDVSAGDASKAIVAAERLIEGLRPDRETKSQAELDREGKRISEMRTMSAAAFERQHGSPVGGVDAYIARVQQSHDEAVAERQKSIVKQKRVRQLFDDLGGAAVFKDAKMSWDDWSGDDYDDEVVS
jgi:hypothetical protein